MDTSIYRFPHADGCEPGVIKFEDSIDDTFGVDRWKDIKTLDEMRAIWAEQGAALESALRGHVSGALYDALFASMAAHKAGLLVIAHTS